MAKRIKQHVMTDAMASVVTEICEQLYNKEGIQAVINYADKIKLDYHFCKQCEAEMPFIKSLTEQHCAVCGTHRKEEPTLKDFKKLVSKLGFRGLKSYAELYPNGGKPYTFGSPKNSAWTLSIVLNADNLVECVEVRTTYFEPTEQIKMLNTALSNKAQSVEWCIEFFK